MSRAGVRAAANYSLPSLNRMKVRGGALLSRGGLSVDISSFMVRDAQALLKTVVVEEKRRRQNKAEKVRQPRDPLDGCLVREMTARLQILVQPVAGLSPGSPRDPQGSDRAAESIRRRRLCCCCGAQLVETYIQREKDREAHTLESMVGSTREILRSQQRERATQHVNVMDEVAGIASRMARLEAKLDRLLGPEAASAPESPRTPSRHGQSEGMVSSSAA